MSRYLNTLSQAGNLNGKAIEGATLSFYEAGPTTTFLATYQDEDLTIENTNPVVADGQGRFPDIWLQGVKYYVVYKDADGVVLDAQDNVTGLIISGATTLVNIAAMTALIKSALLDGAVFEVDGYTTQGDGGGGRFYWTAASTTTANAGTVFAADEGGTGRWTRILEAPWTTAWFGITADASTDNTTAVQATLDAAGGEHITNPLNAFFALETLTFADGNFDTNKGRYNLMYWANDDSTDPVHPGSHDTNELMHLRMNNNPSGYNNETIFTSGYSSGLIVDTKRDLNTPALGAGQDIEFGRASVVWAQDGKAKVQFKYTDSAGDTSSPGLDDGFTIQYIENRVVISGINQASFAATLAVKDMVKGTTSGARGWVRAIGASSITVHLLSGQTNTNKSGFAVGETIILEPAVETTSDVTTVIGSISNSSKSNTWGVSSKMDGNTFINMQGDNAIYNFNVSGIIGAQRAYQLNTAYTHAELIAAEDLSDLSTKSLRWRSEATTGDAVLLVDNVEVLRLDASGNLTGPKSIEISSTVGGIIYPDFTSTQILDITHPINTTNKQGGLTVNNITTRMQATATGTAAADTWYNSDGTLLGTPA